MSTNDFELNNLTPENPEMQPPEQATLHSLLDKVADLTSLPIGHDTLGKGVGRSVPMYELMIVNGKSVRGTRGLVLSYFMFHEDEGLMATVTYAENEGFSGDKVLTRYELRNTIDGLSMEKQLKTIQQQADTQSDTLDRSNIESEIQRRAEKMATAEDEEDSINLNFVSEAEARLLLYMMQNEFVPYGKKGLR